MCSGFSELYKKNTKKTIKSIVKPSTELIPDEYDVRFSGNEYFHIFVSDNDLVEECVKFFRQINVSISEWNVHFLENEKSVHRHLMRVADAGRKYSLLFVIFWGYSKQDGGFTLEDNSTLPFRKTWSSFLTSSTNEYFLNTPKVFLFNVIQSVRTNQRDGNSYTEPANPYEIPNEADLLIIYKHNKQKEESITFIEELGETLVEFGKSEDLCSIVSIINTTSHFSRPVIISTMLRKLYMIPSKIRGNYLNFELNHELTIVEMEKIDRLLAVAKEEKMQSSPSFMRKMRNKISSSFRSKTAQINDRPEVNKKKKEISVKNDSKIEEEKYEIKKISTSSRPSIDRTRRPSVVKLPARKDSVEGRKPWKP